MSSKKFLTAAEILELVEDEEFWGEIDNVDVFITPPEDGEESEEDSADENDQNINHLSGRQLQAQAVATIQSKANQTIHLAEESDEEDNIPLIEFRKRIVTNKEIQRNWSKNQDLEPNFAPFRSPKNFQIISSDPVERFEVFFDEEVCEFLKNMTIKYAKSKGDHNFDMSVGELKCFLAILLLSGYLNIPRWRMFWECDTETYNPFVANAMRRNRFEQIKKYLHCSANDNLAQNDKFAKVRPLFDLLNIRYMKYAEMQENLSVDESMVPYFGRHSAKQFLKGKPIRFGYKMWCLCEPLGYLMKFEPYQGKQQNRTNMDLGVGGSVVMNLLAELPKNEPFKIYADRYFTSLKIVNRLQEFGYGYTGTIMANRLKDCPLSNVKTFQKKERGSFEFCTDINTGITVTAWNDNRVVLPVSSCNKVEPINQVTRLIPSEKKKLPVTQPNVMAMYNKHMGGVDRMDENIDRYRVSIRSKKWWWTPFTFCLDTAVHNAWQLHRKHSPEKSKLDYLHFRRNIVQVYLKKYATAVVGGGRPKSSKEIGSRVPESVRYDRIDHWIVPAIKQNRCALCKKNSTKCCNKCGVNLHDG